jgi:hypothetical protein
MPNDRLWSCAVRPFLSDTSRKAAVTILTWSGRQGTGSFEPVTAHSCHLIELVQG